MKQKALLHQPIKKGNHLPLEVLDAASTERAIQLLHGEGNLYWHTRIRNLFADAGIATRRIEKMKEHPIWECWLTRQTFDLHADNQRAIRQLRKILRDGGLNVVRDQLNFIDRRGDKLRIVFMLDLGAPGILHRRSSKVKQVELWGESH